MLKLFRQKNESSLAVDAEGCLTFMTTSEYQLGFTMKEWPDITFHKTREHNFA
jgi:peptide chain release factor 3